MSEKKYPCPSFPHMIHGADYNPEQWPQEYWDRDMELMQQANCNEMTVGIFAWSTLEPREGEYDFSYLDTIIEKIGEAGGKVILATPSGARPRWLAEKYPEVLRVDAQGNGTWHRVCAALKLLEEAGVETNLLCVVTAQAAKHPQKVYASLRELGGHPLQFIPCLDPMESTRGDEAYSLTPEAYGRFLCSVFDLWYRDWKAGQYISIRLFDDYLRLLLGMAPGSCAASGRCGSYLVAESDGSLYPCDFYVLDAWKLGNVRDMTVAQALNCDLSKAFHAERLPLPEGCRGCKWLSLCRTGCKRDWTPHRENYYCPAFRQFFPYALPRLQEMARSLRRK